MELTAADLADDFDVFDNVTNVTVRQIDPVTGAVTATAANVPGLRSVVSAQGIEAGDGEIRSTTTRFQLPVSRLSFSPKKRDRVTDAAGGVWAVDSVSLSTFGTRYTVEVTRVA